MYMCVHLREHGVPLVHKQHEADRPDEDKELGRAGGGAWGVRAARAQEEAEGEGEADLLKGEEVCREVCRKCVGSV